MSDATGPNGRKPIIAANWKMHHDHLAAIRTVQKLAYVLDKEDYEAVDVVICPPYISLETFADMFDGTSLFLGAQNMFWKDKGAYTGEISPTMIKGMCDYVILGHSERRHLFRETDEEISRKVAAALRHGLCPLLCVGETAEERRQGLTYTVIEGQLRAGWAGLGADEIARSILAYEPVWAIGTGLNATPAQAAEVHGYLRGLVSELASKETAQSLRILYGGSVKPDNTKTLMGKEDIDGVLVGGASLDPKGFSAIVKFL